MGNQRQNGSLQQVRISPLSLKAQLMENAKVSFLEKVSVMLV